MLYTGVVPKKHNTADSCAKSEEENAAAYLPERVTLSMPGPVVATQLAEEIVESPDLAWWRERAEW